MLKKYLLYFCVLASLVSCRKVIDIDLNEGEIKYVIEGVITNEPGVCRVHITQTKAFDENNQFPGVSGAIVKVKDNGIETLLTETQAGVYTTNVINGTPGHVYELNVSINNQVFTATCTMPQPVNMDTLAIEPGPFGEFVFATVGYTDPAGVNNGYRFVQYVNNVKDPAVFSENDEFTDGQFIITQLDNGIDQKDDPRNIDSGDSVTIEMLTIDDAVYTFWNTLISGGGDGSSNSAAPANPLTNIKGGALGYFSAHTIDRRTVIAP